MNESTEFDKIVRVVGAVSGVRDVAVAADRRLRHGRAPKGPTTVASLSGSPLPGDLESTVIGAVPPRRPRAVGTVSEALITAARDVPERGTTYVLSDGSTDRQTYAELLDEASRVLTGLRELGLRAGDPVLLQCGDNRTFVTAFWACVLGGFVPTAVGVAPDYGTDNAIVRKLRAAWELLDEPLILTETPLRDQVLALAVRWGAGKARVASVAETMARSPAEPFPVGPDDPFVNLLTSGSTGAPKCVHHTHRSVVARTYAAIEANGFTEDDVSLNWMPLDHVGGMVMFNVRDTFLGCEHVNARTEAVIRRPLNWLDWSERFAVTTTWAPNFAFSLVNRHEEEIREGRWDLSRLRNVCNAGEAVVARTAFRFLDLLTPHGLPPTAMVPCWGMSETSSGVLYSNLDAHDPTVGTLSVDPASLDGRVEKVEHGSPGALTLVEVGTPVAGFSFRIVDDQGRVLPEGRVGRLQVAGNTVMREYLRNPEANAAFVGDGWFDTGDLGLVHEGRLTLTGRRKHMIIANGVNHPAQEVEAVVEQVPGVRPACSAVCGIQDEETGTDAVLVFFVPTEEGAADLGGTVTAVREALARDLSLMAKYIVAVTEGEFPRAPGGKVQRERLLEAFRNGRFTHCTHDGVSAHGHRTEDPGLERVMSPVEKLPSEGSEDSWTVVYASASAGWPRALRGSFSVIHPGTEEPGEAPTEDVLRVEDTADPVEHGRVLTELIGRRGKPERVVYAWETGEETKGDERAPARFLAALAAIARSAPEAELTVVTQRALGVHNTDPVIPARAALTAMVRTAVTEGTLSSITLVDAPIDADDRSLADLAMTRYDADVTGVRDRTGYTTRLREVDSTGARDVPTRFLPPGGTALVTGGLGGLGRRVTEHLLVSCGARVLVIGRTPEDRLTGAARENLAELRDLGEVRYRAQDVACVDELSQTVAEAELAWGRSLDLVVHLAGASIAPQWERLSAHELTRESAEWLDDMLRPKLGGGAAIESLLERRPETAVILFSSVNGLLGGSGFGAYSAANAALSGYAHRWSAHGRPIRCLEWSMWSGPGMNEGNPLVSAALSRGLRSMDTAEGIAQMLDALNQDASFLVLGADIDNPAIKAWLAPDQFRGASVVVAIVSEDGEDQARVRKEASTALFRAGVLAQITMRPTIVRDAAGRVDEVSVLYSANESESPGSAPQGADEISVAEGVGRVLGLDRVGRDDSFFVLGFDSIRSVQLAEEIGGRFGQEVAVGLLYEYPTVRALAGALSQR
ncbi:SDR family NAD(P)-dependent oxidoreductase [Nocardiopsis alkaliphila]|uniref:SDR family NAD(P)-dependent oxidoreductase n=1 Tax=Nocardiopsis alkaliphila TaxID=225762 RepID=UPI00034BBA5D|nr:SDR family NAD(P)-dependent oxidoreductase [Nocardiopsis alkaliphila]